MPSILTQPIYTDVRTYTGDPDVPRDVQNLRISNHDTMRWMGTPVLLKRIYTIEDVENGVATQSPSMDPIYGQAPSEYDPLSYGVGYVSVATQQGEWYDPASGAVYANVTNPDPSYLPAPLYRGYGPGFLTYAILPDRPEDVMRFTPQGTLIRTQTGRIQLPWWPQLGDNDLVIEVELNPNGTIAKTNERYQLKMVTPQTLRGLDRSGRREFDSLSGGNRYWIGQEADLVRIPYSPNEPIYQVEVDR